MPPLGIPAIVLSLASQLVLVPTLRCVKAAAQTCMSPRAGSQEQFLEPLGVEPAALFGMPCGSGPMP